MTFGVFILTREITRRTANPGFVARLQATPAIAQVVTLADLFDAMRMTPAEVYTAKSLWDNYRVQYHTRARRAG